MRQKEENPVRRCAISCDTTYVEHTFEPVFDSTSRILVLGSIPSPKSREQGFYYGHPRNRFWPVLAKVLGSEPPRTIEEKKALALSRHVAIWDVLAGCDIHGADDSSIRNPRPNDLNRIMGQAPIGAVFTTGARAGALYKRFCRPVTGMDAISLPSTSPANCRVTEELLVDAYSVILEYLAHIDGFK